MTRGEDRQLVRADVVGDVAVGGDAFGAHEDCIHPAGLEQPADGRVRHEDVVDAGLGQLPGHHPGPIERRPGFGHVDQDVLLGRDGRLDHRQGRAELAAGQRSGVAVRQDRERTVRDHRQDRPAGLRDAAVVRRGLEDDRLGLLAHDPRDPVAVLADLADRFVP